MSANRDMLNTITIVHFLPTTEECENAYHLFLQKKCLGQQDCKIEHREELFEIIDNMAKCKETFAYCHTCLVIYNKSKYGHHHLDNNAGSLRAYFNYDSKQTKIDKDEILVQMFKKLRCYCVLMDTLFQYPICNTKKCGDNLKSYRENEQNAFECLQAKRDSMFQTRSEEQHFSIDLHKKIRPVGMSTKQFLKAHKRIQLSRIKDIQDLWEDVTKMVMSVMFLSVSEYDKLYIEDILEPMSHNFQTVKTSIKILNDINNYEECIKPIVNEDDTQKNIFQKKNN